jgi:hypothetical protein
VGNASSGAERTLAPAALAFTRYEVSFSSTTGTKAPVPFGSDETIAVDLSPGEWTITLTAYTGTGAAEKASARGSAKKTIAVGNNGSLDITLKPYGESGVTGTFSYGITIAEAISSGSLTIASTSAPEKDLKTVDLTKEADRTGTAELAAGYYLMNIAIVKDKTPVGRTETLHIYPGLTTSVSYKFEGKELVNITPKATVANVSISGTAGVALSGDVTITLENTPLKTGLTVDDNLDSWFTGLPGGLQARPKAAAQAGAATFTIAITGTPSAASVASLSITIPTNALSSNAALTVTDNANAHFAIALPAPTASPITSHNPTQAVALACVDTGAEIWYTLDGSDPVANGNKSTKYTTTIPVPFNTTLKAIAVKDGVSNSVVLEQVYPDLPAEDKPVATGIDYENEVLKGLSKIGNEETQYGIALAGNNYDAYDATGNGELDIKKFIDLLTTPGTLNVIRISQKANKKNSEPQQFALSPRPAAPPDVVGVGTGETSGTKHDGKITGTTTTMEYKTLSGTSWTECTDTETTGLAPNSYQVRYKAVSGSTFASAIANVTIYEAVASPYGIFVGATKVGLVNGLAEALVWFQTEDNFKDVATDYVLKLPPGTEKITDRYLQIILWGMDEFMDAPIPSFYKGSTLTLSGADATTIIEHCSNDAGELFQIYPDMTLILEGPITIKGYNGNATARLISVEGGTLIMKDNAVITGVQSGGAVGVREDPYDGIAGLFRMEGGTITGNTAVGGGAGVEVLNNGKFEISGGEIKKNTVTTTDVKSYSSNGGGGVGIQSGGIFIKTGGIIYGNNAGADSNTSTGRETDGAAVYVHNADKSTPHRNTTVTAAQSLSYTGKYEADAAVDADAELTGVWTD